MSKDFCPNCFTVGVSGHCPHCGYNALAQAENHQYLRPGVVLNERYLIGRTLGAGGFGITYLAKDQSSSALCAIKEYLPGMLAVRDETSHYVRPSSVDNEATFRHGLDVFAGEAKTLRQFTGNPMIVQVYDDFSANGTGYFAMEYLDGVTLKTLMNSMGGTLNVAMGREIIINVALTLAAVHRQGMLHRDVSPDNIFITKEGQTKLIDFGATRFFVGERSQSLSVILKPGFAPPEQYMSRGKQGPHTDLYALCATLYYICLGQGIPEAPDRLAGAVIVPPVSAIPGIDPSLASVIERGLSLDFRHRPADMDAFLRELGAANTAPLGKGNSDQPAPSPSAKGAAPPSAPPAVTPVAPIRINAVIHGSPFVELKKGSASVDKWLIPKNIAISIGRSTQMCNLIIDAPNISRVHCTVFYDEKQGLFYLTDRSTNGTYVGGARLAPGESRPLNPGDSFYLTDSANLLKVGLE